MVLRVIHSVVVHVADVESPIIIHDFGGGVRNGNYHELVDGIVDNPSFP